MAEVFLTFTPKDTIYKESVITGMLQIMESICSSPSQLAYQGPLGPAELLHGLESSLRGEGRHLVEPTAADWKKLVTKDQVRGDAVCVLGKSAPCICKGPAAAVSSPQGRGRSMMLRVPSTVLQGCSSRSWSEAWPGGSAGICLRPHMPWVRQASRSGCMGSLLLST